MMTLTVRTLIDEQATLRPHATYALAADGSSPMTYSELALSCACVSGMLEALEARPGSTVSLVLPNGLHTLRLMLGAMYGGWCVNPVNLLSQPEQMQYVLDHSDCQVVITNSEWAPRVRTMLAGIARPIALVVCEADDPMLQQGARTSVPPAEGDPALLMYTSGTTGRPKGVLLSQRNLAANARAISAEHQLGAHDRVLGVLPLYHINAFSVTMLAPLAHGGSVAMAEKFSAARFWEQAASCRCTWINVVPTIISYLLEGQAPPQGVTDSIRFCRSASAALPPEHLKAFEQRFGIGVIETMGLTETAAPSFSNPVETSRRKLGAVGRPSGCEAMVVDAAWRTLPVGQTGEIVIRGPNVMLGYYKDVEATRAAFMPGGWLRTGDLGHQDADGFFYVTGRIKELIIKGGENIAPREVDEALLGHPCVLEAAAVGIPDRHYGQEIMACVVLKPGHAWDEDAVRSYCVEVLGRYKTPRTFHVLEELPRGPSGKVQRLKLLEIVPVARTG